MSSNIDDKIKQALEREVSDEQEFKLMEPGIFDLMIDTFKGRQRWLAMYSIFITFLMMGVFIFSLVKFFQADSVVVMLRWSVGVIFSMLAVAMLKMWYWMQLDKHYITREIKRLELRVMHLAQTMDKQNPQINDDARG